MTKLKVAIIGYGYMGEIRKRCVEAHKNMSLEAICEIDSGKLDEHGQDYLILRDPSQVIEGDYDAVFVCTPNKFIPELTVEALKHGKHVFCEKPPGTCLDDIVKMRDQEEKSPGLTLMFGFNHRYHPAILRAQKLIKSGTFGRLLWLRGIYGKSGGQKFGESWRNDRQMSGGGILLDQGIHMLDLFNMFTGGFDDIKAFVGHGYWNFEVEDNAFVVLKNKDGHLGSLHSSATLWKHRFQLDFGLEGAYLTAEGLLSKTGSYGREMLKIGHRQFEDEAEAVGNPSEEIIYFDKDQSWDIEVGKFAEAILSEQPLEESNSMDAYKAMKLVDQAYRDTGLI